MGLMDILAIGAHPDDCELFMGGTLAKMAALGYKVAIADLTRGECATRGTPEMRRMEAEQAAKVLGLTKRIPLDLGDSRVGLDPADRTEVVRLLRRERPLLVFSHGPDDRHPDHERVCRLVREACFFANVAGFDTGQKRFRPAALVEFIGNTLFSHVTPSFIVPINETFEQKVESLRAYKSQFYDPQGTAGETWISSKVYFEQIEARDRYWGSLIGENYGEAFSYRGLLAVGDPVPFFKEAGGKGG
jgi:bacillithiol biosynthesis deacetylase BshB1